VQDSRLEVHLRPFEVDKLDSAQPMAKGEQNHSRVTVTVAVALSGFNQRLDFRRGEVFAGAQLGIRPAQRSNCPIYSGWRDDRERRLCQDIPRFPACP
jgi:hypothetical protein